VLVYTNLHTPASTANHLTEFICWRWWDSDDVTIRWVDVSDSLVSIVDINHFTGWCSHFNWYAVWPTSKTDHSH